MTPTRPWLAPVLVALAAVFPPSGFSQAPAAAPNSAPLLLRYPSLSQDRIAFRYADDIWTVNRRAARLGG